MYTFILWYNSSWLGARVGGWLVRGCVVGSVGGWLAVSLRYVAVFFNPLVLQRTTVTFFFTYTS